MPEALTGRQEIEETLRDSRDRVERVLANARLVVFAGGIALTAGIHVALGEKAVSWVPTGYFVVATIYAVLALALVRRHGAHPAIVYATLLLDMAMAGLPGVVFDLFGVFAGDPYGMHWMVGVNSSIGGILFILLINTFRHHRGAAVLGALAGAALFASTAVRFAPRIVADLRPLPDGQPRPLAFVAFVVPLFLILMTGVVGMMAAGEARRRLERFARHSLLRRYLSSEAVQRVEEGDPDAAVNPGGDHREVTILASDLRGFTALSETLPPEAVLEQLNVYHGAMLEVIERHGGILDKFIGDGALAVFGFDRGADAGAAAAVACAREMLVRLEALNATRAAAGRPPHAIGVGIHTGVVIAGNVGARGRIEFTVIGDVVNTASRLEGVTKEAGVPVIVSQATAARLPSLEGLQDLGTWNLRGRAGSLRVYGVGSHPEATAAVLPPAVAPVADGSDG